MNSNTTQQSNRDGQSQEKIPFFEKALGQDQLLIVSILN